MECGAAGVPGLPARLEQRQEDENVTTQLLKTAASSVEGTRCRQDAAETNVLIRIDKMYCIEKKRF